MVCVSLRPFPSSHLDRDIKDQQLCEVLIAFAYSLVAEDP